MKDNPKLKNTLTKIETTNQKIKNSKKIEDRMTLIQENLLQLQSFLEESTR
jgi:hypothetical protein